MNTAERFWAKVRKTEGCWWWEAATDGRGYGQMQMKTSGKWRPMKAHRIALMVSGIALVDGLDVDHICRNRLCVRPDHLRQVSRKQNMENGFGPAGRGKSAKLRGVYWSKKSKKWVAQIGHNRKTTSLGLFATREEAHAAVLAKRNELYTHNTYEREAA